MTIRHKRLAALLDAADPWDPILLEVAARTGLCRGDAIGLVWSEVDFAGSPSITRRLNAVGRRVALKTDRSARTVDHSARLTDKLREHRLASRAPPIMTSCSCAEPERTTPRMPQGPSSTRRRAWPGFRGSSPLANGSWRR